MALERRALAEEFLELDVQTKQQLIELAALLSPHRDRIGQLWSETYQRSAGRTAMLPETQAKLVTSELLDLFFTHVARGDFEGYHQAILVKGKEYQATELAYGHLLLAIHDFEQVTLPFLTEAYSKHADLERAVVAVDHLCDNAIALIASSYFETTLAQLRALQQVTDTALSTLDLEQLLRSLLLRMVEAIDGDVGAVLLRDASTGELHLRTHIGASLGQTGTAAAKPGDGLGSWVVAQEAPVQVSDAQSDPLITDQSIKRAGVGAMVSVPLKLGSRITGVVHVGRLSRDPFRPRETQLLELLAERAAAAIDHAQLHERTAHLLCQTAALQRVTTSINAKMALPQVLEVVIDGLVEAFGANRVAICLQGEQTGELRCPASRGLSAELISAVRERYRESAVGKALATGKHFYSADVPRDQALDAVRPEIDREGILTVLILPFGHGSETAGTLCLYHHDVRRYDEEERRLAQTFADQTAIAIANATLYREIRERAAELDRANSELQILDRMKADFLAMISHELRTPLTAILGYTDLLLRGARGELDQRPISDLTTIRSNGHRLLTLINDLIDFSSLEAGHASLTTRSLQLNRLLSSLLRSFTPLARAHSITLRLELRGELPTVVGDATAVEKILNQLLSNAIKFTPPGGAVIVSAEESVQPAQFRAQPIEAVERAGSAEQRRVVVAISDNGIGIAPEQMPRIWDHFYQVDSTSARRFGGTGLGLAIVKRLVELQGGHIWAESAGVSGKGSTFRFTLPITSDPSERVAAP